MAGLCLPLFAKPISKRRKWSNGRDDPHGSPDTKLAVQAKQQSEEALEHAMGIAVAMGDHEVELCKKAAKAAIEYERQHGEAK